MDKVEKEIEEILKGVAGRVYCVICSGYDFECGCEIDVNQRNIHNATIEITAVMKAKDESWRIICKDKQTKIDKLQVDLTEKNKEIEKYKERWKETAVEGEKFHIERDEFKRSAEIKKWKINKLKVALAEKDKETKRLRKIVDKVKVIDKYLDVEGVIRKLDYSYYCDLKDLLEELEQSLKGT